MNATDRPTAADIQELQRELRYHADADLPAAVRDWLAPILAAEVERRAGPLAEACRKAVADIRFVADERDACIRHLRSLLNCWYEFSDQPGCPGMSDRVDDSWDFLAKLDAADDPPPLEDRAALAAFEARSERSEP